MLEPVHVGGVIVKQATLHNEEDLARKDLRIGEQVIVLRAGDVIPQVVAPAPHVAEHSDRPPKPQPPARCPVCDTPTLKPEDSVFTLCPNRDCAGRRFQLLTSFVWAMDIDGCGEISARKLFDAIEASKAQPFGRVLFAIGIEEVGDVTGRNLSGTFRTVDALLDADPEALERTPGVGPKMAR